MLTHRRLLAALPGLLWIGCAQPTELTHFNRTCIDEPAMCDDGLACTKDICTPDGTCEHEVDPAYCDDGDPCTDDTCTAQGTCTYSPTVNCQAGACDDHADCDDTVECTTDVCNSDGTCTNVETPACVPAE